MFLKYNFRKFIDVRNVYFKFKSNTKYYKLYNITIQVLKSKTQVHRS